MWLLATLAENQDPVQPLDFIGAGEGIRTLDPNLGKVGIVQTQVRSPTIAHPGPSDGNRSSRRSLSAKIDALRSNG